MMVTVEVVMEVFERLVDDDVDEVERVGMIIEVTKVHKAGYIYGNNIIHHHI